MTPPPTADTDVLVVGGGPVGLAAAIEARLAGLGAVVVEPRTGPIDKACGEGLMPGTVAALGRLGVRPAGHPIAGIAYVDASRRAEHRFHGSAGLGVRRTVLHAALARRADELCVDVVQDRVRSLSQDAAGVSAAGVRARWLLACDGLHSGVRRLVGLERAARGDRPERAGRRFGLRRHLRLAPWDDLVEVHWGTRVEAYVTPVAQGLVGVALLGPAGMDFEEELAGLQELAGRLRGAEPDGPVRGAGPLRQRTHRRVRGRVLLVGDASGYVDALTGEGISLALAQAEAAVAAIVAGRPAAYEADWRRIVRRYRLLTEALLVAAAVPAVRRRLVPAARALPRVFAAAVDEIGRTG